MQIIRYGGAVTGASEEKAIIKSIRKSRKTRNWQQAEEGKLFEQELAKYVGVKYAVLTNSGSSAGLLALSALELPKGSEVIISAVTFPTIFNIILQCGLKPVVVDVDRTTNNFDLNEVTKAITANTKAIIAIHALGNPVDLILLRKICDKKGIKLFLDNCDGLGTKLNGKYVEQYADVAITSLHAAHIVSMGVGGVVFSNKKLPVRMYRDWGRQADLNISKNTKHKDLPSDYNPRFIYEKVGFNFQILELQAAMGRVQLRKIEQVKKLRQKNFNFLVKKLKDLPISFPYVLPKADVCWFALPLMVKDRPQLLKYLDKKGIETRPIFAGNITKHPGFTSYKKDLPNADLIMKNAFWISAHPSLTQKQLNYIVKVFDAYFA